jgi:hypothetical protein
MNTIGSVEVERHISGALPIEDMHEPTSKDDKRLTGHEDGKLAELVELAAQMTVFYVLDYPEKVERHLNICQRGRAGTCFKQDVITKNASAAFRTATQVL